MNDQELITAVRQSVHGVRMNVPAGQILSRSRAIRARGVGGAHRAEPEHLPVASPPPGSTGPRPRHAGRPARGGTSRPGPG